MSKLCSDCLDFCVLFSPNDMEKKGAGSCVDGETIIEIESSLGSLKGRSGRRERMSSFRVTWEVKIQ